SIAGSPAVHDRNHYLPPAEGGEVMKLTAARVLAAAAFSVAVCAQQVPPPAGPVEPSNAPGTAMLSQKDAEQLATRLLQLIESTAVSVPGLVRASEPVKQNAELTLTGMQRTPQNPAITYQFINQVKAYMALSDSIPRPYPFPQTADRQFAE